MKLSQKCPHTQQQSHCIPSGPQYSSLQGMCHSSEEAAVESGGSGTSRCFRALVELARYVWRILVEKEGG